MRIGIGKISQETNTFSPALTDLDMLHAFGVYHGQDVLDVSHWSEYIQGFLDVVGDQELVGITHVTALPSGPLTEAGLDAILEWFDEDLEKALPLDGLLLSMHGAFAALTDTDVEGLILRKARETLGPGVAIGVALDLHANISRRKIENADVIYGLHTHPHIDSREVAQKVARVLLAALRGEVKPVISAVKIPLITPAETQLSYESPLKDLMEATLRQEDDERVLASSVFAVQPWMDIPEMGWCSVVVTDGDRLLADQLVRDLAAMTWDQRETYTRPCPTYLEALDEAFSTDLQPVVISDFADLMTGGGTGDSVWYLKELLARNPSEPCYITMVDAEAAQRMAEAGAGADVTLMLGGKLDNIYSSPVQVRGTILRVLPVAPDRALPSSMGLTCVLRIGNIYVVTFERLGMGSDPSIYADAGLDPMKAKIVIAKSVVDWREGYKDVGKLFLLGEAPGLAPSNLRSLEWKKVPRPIFPLDQGMAWDSAKAVAYRSDRRA